MKYIGRRFGKLIIIEYLYTDINSARHYRCLCDCGEYTDVYLQALKSGNTKSCGCLRKLPMHRTHGMCGTSTYRSWYHAKDRCTNPKDPAYKNYGGRGIIMCDSWLDFNNFLKDMGEKPHGCHIHRIDNNRGYYRANCIWIKSTEHRQLTHRR
jgi:hypothetical protein